MQHVFAMRVRGCLYMDVEMTRDWLGARRRQLAGLPA